MKEKHRLQLASKKCQTNPRYDDSRSAFKWRIGNFRGIQNRIPPENLIGYTPEAARKNLGDPEQIVIPMH